MLLVFINFDKNTTHFCGDMVPLKYLADYDHFKSAANGIKFVRNVGWLRFEFPVYWFLAVKSKSFKVLRLISKFGVLEINRIPLDYGIDSFGAHFHRFS